jgi:CheY-like chemotaxis protein
MINAPESARLLVVCGKLPQAGRVTQALLSEFEDVRTTVDPDRLVADFESLRPDVLIFAFGRLAESESAQRELYRVGRSILGHPFRTVVLCGDADLDAAFDLCRHGHFDDFVHWADHPHEAQRLIMSVRIALRKLSMQRPAMPTLGDLLGHARHLEELEQLLGQLFAEPDPLQAEAGAAWARQFRLPVEAALAGVATLVAQVRKVRPMVLVVDDDALARTLISRALDPQAFDVRLAGDGVEAVSQLRRMRPDVILMDVRMPGLDGVSLAQRLKLEPQLASIPIILMTGDGSRETLASSIDVGAAAFVLKPYTRESLTAKLEKVLRLG